MYTTRRFICSLLFATAAVAQAPPLATVQPPADGARLSQHVVLVVDCSGSMSSFHAQAINLACALAETGSDDYKLHAVAFGSGAVAWPAGWQDMPSEDAKKNLRAWLETLRPEGRAYWNPNTHSLQTGQSGPLAHATKAKPALAKAFELHKDASVILITDGEFTDMPSAKGPDALAILQVGRTDGTAGLAELAQRAKLGWYRPAAQ